MKNNLIKHIKVSNKGEGRNWWGVIYARKSITENKK